jgi:hypothetical protein
LKIITEILTNEDHFRKNFTSRIGFVRDFEIKKEKFLNGVIVASENVTDYGDEELRNCFTVEEKHDRFLESFDLCSDVVSFESFFDLGG